MGVKMFTDFIVQRELARINKEHPSARHKPDPIISEYRFCNVRRNDDRVTKWIHGNIMEPLCDDPNLWFHLIIARLFNKPETLDSFTYQQYITWRPETWRKRLKQLREKGPIFNGAYIVSTNGMAMDKVDYVIDCILGPLWKNRKDMGRWLNEAPTLDAVHKILMSVQGLGSFMAAQVVADLKYRPGAARTRWPDFDTFAASGPGSRRGLNRVYGGPVGLARTEDDFRDKLSDIRAQANTLLARRPGMKHLVPLTAQDVQNCLCEYDKYERARLGEGRPKQKYTPYEEAER